MTPLAQLQNSSFFPESKENLTLIPCKEASTEQRSKQSNFIYNPTKRTINWEIYIHFGKLFYTKVSRKRRLTVGLT